MTDVAPSQPPASRARIGCGMEQFHHPRPVRTGRGTAFRPTAQREWLVAGLTGRVLEFGAGDGVKLTCYPPNLDEIILVEPESFLRATAQQVADTIPVPVRIVDSSPTHVPLSDSSCDAVLCSLVLCCAPVEATLAEVRRVLRPGGELRFYEHVRSASRPLALTETLLTPLWSRACGGCHPARDPVAALKAAGFTIDRLDRFTFDRFSHVLGIARVG